MALYLVLEDYSDGSATIAAGSLLDDGAVDLARLQSAGLAAVVYNASTMSASREAFVAARGSRPVAPDTSGDLSALLLAAGAIGGSGGGVASVAGSAPITSSGGANPTIGIAAATPLAAGSMSAADKAKLDGIGTIVTSVTASGPLASSGGTTPDVSLTAGTTPGDVLTWDGANWSGAAPAGGGTIGGTIAANEVAFGTGPDAIGGSAQLEWNPGTNTLTIADPTVAPVLQVDATSQINGKVTVTGGTASCFSIVSSIDGEFVSVDPSLFTVTVKDALSPSDYYANISPSDVTVADNPAQTSGQVNGQGVQAFDAATTNFAALRVVAGVPTLLAQDTATTTDQPLDVVVGELRLAGNSGAAGEVLTSNGPGVAPTWQAGGGGGAAYDQMLYVADGADPALANGSPAFPFASISAALASISDASPTKRYTVMITAGEYTEAGAVNLKPNVFLCGVVPDAVRITASSWGLDPTFTGGADNRTGIHNCIVTGAVNLNFTTVTSTAGKFYARSTMFVSAVTLTGYNNPIVQAQFSGCQFFGLVTVQGVNVGVANDNIHFAGLTLTQSPFASVPTIWSATGGTLNGTLTATTTVNDFNRRISLFCKSFWMGTVNIDGPSTYLDYTVDCLPTAGATVTGGASLVLINPASGVGANTELSNLVFPTAVNNPIIPATTNATNMGDWNKQWMFSFGYVHLSTGTELYLASAGASASPDTAGRSIFVESDTYGLDTDVNGGDIHLTTQAGVSGTGVRGNVNIATRQLNLSLDGAMNVNGAPGAAGEVLTSQGAGAAPLWVVPDVPVTISGQHSNPSPIDVGAFYFSASRTVGVSSSALVEMSGGVGLWQAQIQLVNLSGTVVATFDTGIQGFAGYYSATLTPATPVVIPAGWYRVTLANIGSGTATALGLFLSAV